MSMKHKNELVSNITSVPVTVFLSSFFDLTWADCTIFNEPVLTACWPFTSCFVFEAYSHQSFHFKLSFVSTSAIKLHGNTPSFVSICMSCNHSIWTNFQLECAQRTQTSTKTPNLNQSDLGFESGLIEIQIQKLGCLPEMLTNLKSLNTMAREVENRQHWSPILQSWEKIKSNLESVSGTNQHQKLISSNWSAQS